MFSCPCPKFSWEIFLTHYGKPPKISIPSDETQLNSNYKLCFRSHFQKRNIKILFATDEKKVIQPQVYVTQLCPTTL